MLRGIDHLYAETLNWDASAAFWEGLGFVFEERWGSDGHRAGRLRSGDAVVVLAEVTGDPQATPFFDIDSTDSFVAGPAVEVVSGPEDTHWGTRWIRVKDPDGRVYALEESAP